MALDIVDIMLIFWTLVASGTFVLGNAYENYLKQQQQQQQQKVQAKKKIGEDQLDQRSPSHQYSPTKNNNTNDLSDNTKKSYNDHYPPTDFHYQHQHQHQQQQSRANNYDNSQPEYTKISYYAADHKDNEAAAAADSYQQRSGTIYNYHRNQESATQDNSIPTATGFNNDYVEWINKILYLFYSSSEQLNSRYVQIISESLCRSLNEKLSNLQQSTANNNNNNSSGQNNNNNNKSCNFKLAFRDVVREASSRPELTNVRTETESDRSVSTICKIYNRRLVLDLTVTIVNGHQLHNNRTQNIIGEKASRASLYDGYDPLYHGQAYQDQQQQAQQQQQQHADSEPIMYELYLENLEGKLKSVAIVQDKLIVVQFMERPDTKITLKAKYDSAHTMKQQHGASLQLNEDAIINLVMQTFTQVVVDLYFGDDPNFPMFLSQQPLRAGNTLSRNNNASGQLVMQSSSQERKQIKQDFFSVLTNKTSSSTSHASTNKHQQQQQEREKKIFIKVNKASNINYNNNVYCRIEVDEPSQRFNTAVKQGNEPIWDEHFIFNLNDKSNEMLFELWDGVPTLKKTTKDHHHHHDRKKGAGDKFLGMAIVSMEELERNPVQKQLLELQSRPMESDNIAGQLFVEFLFMEHSTAASRQVASQYQKGDVVSIDRKLTPSGYVITTTTITKPAAAASTTSQPGGDIDKQLTGRQQQLSPNELDVALSRPQSSLSTNTSDMDMGATHYLNDDDHSSADLEINVASATKQQQQQQQSARRSRPTQRSNSILRAIKKRFSFSKTRSKSVEQRFNGANMGGTGASSASVSRASSINSHTDRARSVPANRLVDQHNHLPSIVIQPGGRGSSLDYDCGASSDYTYTHPSSQLIIESASDGGDNVLRHYLIPPNLANKKSKWRKKGVKIHLYNEHQFIATHLSGPTSCHLCGRIFSRRPGKQGYVCRNCQVISHKQCHVKIDYLCPLGSKNAMLLEYMPTTSNNISDSNKHIATSALERKESLTPDSRQTSRRESRDL